MLLLSTFRRRSDVALPADLAASRSGVPWSLFHSLRRGIIAMLTTRGLLFSGLLLMQLPGTSDKSDKPEAKPRKLGTVLGKPIYDSARNENVEPGEDLERLFL